MAFLAAVIAGLVAGGAIAGYRVATREAGGAPSAGSTPEAGSPQATADAWASAWTLGDTRALWELLTPAAQQAFPFEIFKAEYDSFAVEITLSQLAASVRSAQEISASFAVHLATGYFGEFDYEVSLPLVKSGSGFLAAWEPSAIHPRLTADVRFKSEIQRPRRGAILDRNGQPLAITREVRMLGLNRSVVADRGYLTNRLIEFGFTADQVNAAFNSSAGSNQRVAVGMVPDERLEDATQLARIPGVLLYFETRRVHPLGPSAAHVVGYTRELTAEELTARRGQGYRIGDRIGAVGLESFLEEKLAGRIGAELRLAGPNGETIEVVRSTAYVPAQDVTTTLDSATLVTAQARLGQRAGAAVTLDPRTNAILALNSSPSFDPDAFERNDRAALEAITSGPGSPLANRATTGLYSPGSTFKLITGAAGLAYGGFSPAGRIECGATWHGVDPPRKNWEGAQGALTIAEGLMRSCNPVFYEIALKLYNDTDNALSSMARAFGLGEATGAIGLTEEDGLVPDAAWKRRTRNEPWYPGDEVNMGIGQGDLLVTPIQLANAYSAIIAGALRTPVLLASETAVNRGALPLTEAQAAHLRRGLELVAGQYGTASAAFWNAGYTGFAGKSGTAEDVGAQQHVLFVAYAPAGQPRALTAVVLDEGESGSIEAGPIARDIVLVAMKQ